jgi:hypothetical protein
MLNLSNCITAKAKKKKNRENKQLIFRCRHEFWVENCTNSIYFYSSILDLFTHNILITT